MAELSPVETLRAAAAKLREIGSKASDGPWETGGDGLVWPPRIGDPVSGSTEPEDAEWIALVHPGVAELLADWLEYEARCYQAFGPSVLTDRTPYALAVARVLLGAPDA